MFNTTAAGRIYNGKTYGWEDKSKQERTMFRGRLNYRDPENGEYHYIDAVCFKDFGDKGGLVQFLEDNFSAPEDKEDGTGGDAAILVGYVRPTKKKLTAKVDLKTKTGKVTKDVPNIPYSTFEFVITNAYFPPKSAGDESSRDRGGNAEIDEEDLDFDDIEVSSDDDDAAEEPAPKKEEKPKASDKDKSKGRGGSAGASKDKSKGKGKGPSKPQENPDEDEDDDFFDE